MDFSHYRDRPVAIAVDLVNTIDVASGDDTLTSPSEVAAFISEHGEGWSAPDYEPTDRDLNEVLALRSKLREVFNAVDEKEAAAVLNATLADVVATPRVSVHDDKLPHLHFEPKEGSPARWLGAITAMGLAVALVEGGFDRLGSCASTTCEDVFVDTSRNRSRSHCSDTCTTRENVAAFRKRQRGEG
jgi:predicted RNA-binding Zn ribbon-like protein